MDNFVPLVFLALSSSSGTSSSSTSPPQDSSSTSSRPATPRQKNKNKKKQAGNGRPFARPSGMVRQRSSQIIQRTQKRHCPHTFRFGTSYESGIKVKEAQYLYSLPKRPKLRSMLANHDDSDAAPRAEKFGDLITADHKILSDGCESRNNHRYAVVVQDLATQWIQSYPCKKNFSGNTKELAKVLRAK